MFIQIVLDFIFSIFLRKREEGPGHIWRFLKESGWSDNYSMYYCHRCNQEWLSGYGNKSPKRDAKIPCFVRPGVQFLSCEEKIVSDITEE